MVKLLLRKMVRDIRRSLMAYGISAFIVAIGFCGYCVISIAANQLTACRDYFFEVTAFPKTFAEVQSAPAAVAARLSRIPGVERAQARLTRTVRVSGFPQQDTELKLISVEDEGLALPLLSAGMLPESGEMELVVGNGFFNANQLAVGNTLSLAIGGRTEELTICGSGISPENIYMMRSMSEMLPTPATYDAGFISYDTLSSLFSMEGLANEFVLTLAPGVTTEDIEDQVEQILTPYGCIRIYDQLDHLSVGMLQAELEQLPKMTAVVPFLFLSVASVILSISLQRLIQQQRTQAGTFMALGLSQHQVALHYMGYGAFIGFVGGFFGGILGSLLAAPMVDFYRVYFSLPDIPLEFSYSYLFLGTVAATAFCALVGWFCAKSLGQLVPAEALRPAPPKTARLSVLERIPHFNELFTVPGLLAVRSLSRNRRRALISLFGIACAYMITASLVSMSSLFNVFLFDFLEKTQQQDITVSFSSPVPRDDALRAVRDPAIEASEGILEFPVTLHGLSGKLECTVQSVAKDSQLCLLYDEDGNRVAVPEGGIVLSRHMANVLGVEVGGQVDMELSYPRKETKSLPVSAIVAQYMGSTAYMSHSSAGRDSGFGDVYTSVLLKAPQSAQDSILARLEDATLVATVQSRTQRLAQFRSMMGSMSSIMMTMTMMGVLIGLAVIYTSSVISFEELRREVSTMMMLGMSSKQCLDVVSVGQWILTIGGILLGIPMTMGVSTLISTTMMSDLYSIPSFVDTPSLILSALLTFAAVLLSSFLMLRKLNKISPVELLRERE
ncbi:MAG: ABC transporter permease [Angelakisella sp.]